MTSSLKIFIIIPVYNESATIRNIVLNLSAQGYKNIIIIDDGSDEDIRGCLSGLNVLYIRHRTNLGQGAALETGFEFARLHNADAAVTFDADGQHAVEDIASLLEPIISGQADVVLGSRFSGTMVSGMSSSRKIVLQIARVVNFLFTGLMLTDAHNGLRALNEKALGEIRLTENRMAHASEFLFEIQRHHLIFQEVPVRVSYTDYSRKKGQSPLDGIKILFDLVLHKFMR